MSSASAVTLNVKNSPYNAAGNGSTNDTAAVNKAISDANAAGGGTVEFPSGKYLCGSVHLKSNVTLQLDSGSTILGASSGYDAAESNPFSQYQDYGHSHFHNALIWGESLTNVGIVGTGTIDGNGHLNTGDTSPDKAVSLKLCDGVTITGITIRNGGHFGLITNGTNHIVVNNVKILESNQRDAFNLINAKHVDISDSDIEGSDDSMCLKSDFALGQKISNEDIHIDNCHILSTGNNAVQFGSETVGDFSNVTFTHLTLTKAGKAGLGITSNDGSIIDGITFSDITISGCVAPIWMKIDNVHRAPGSPPPGRIRNVSFINITSTGGDTTSTVEGCGTVSPAIPIENVVFNNVKLTVPGGHPASDATKVPPTDDHWQPRYLGTAPSYGFFLRHVKNISFVNCQVGFSSNDGRPALVDDKDGQNIRLDGFVAQVGSGSPYDLGFDGVTGFQVINSKSTGGADLRVHNSGSTTATITAPPVYTPIGGTYSAGQTVALASSTPGAAIHYTTDGSTPTSSTGTLYSGPISLASDTVIKAVASASGLIDSAVATSIYSVVGTAKTAEAPTFNPDGGTFNGPVTVAITTNTPGAFIHYTLDGSTPSATVGTLYSGPVTINSTATLKAVAYESGFIDSSVTSALYSIFVEGNPTAPAFSPAPGNYASSQTITLTSSPGASIRYTLDGTTPSSTVGTLYVAPFTISASTTVKAIAYESGFIDSPVSTGVYSIMPPPPLVFEAESLPHTGTGAPVSIQTDTKSSNGQWVELEANSVGDFIEFTLPTIPAGTYVIQMMWKGNNNRGILNFKVDGVQVGGTLDQYSTSQTYPTTTFGTVTFASASSHILRLTVTGKNGSSGGYNLSADKFILAGQ